MSGSLKYGYLDDVPVVFRDNEAWEYVGGWRRMHAADAYCKARVIGKQAFDEMFAHDDLPPLPVGAFA